MCIIIIYYVFFSVLIILYYILVSYNYEKHEKHKNARKNSLIQQKPPITSNK